MRIMVNHDRDPECEIMGFCEAVTRDPFFLIGNRPRPDFSFGDLRSMTLATVSEVPTPWMCLQDDLRRAGVAPETISRVGDASMSENARALRSGNLEVAQLFQPEVERLLSEGAGHVWYAAATRGPCSYTTLYCLQSTIDAQADSLHRMTRAMYRAQKWLHGQPASAVASAVADFFPQCAVDVLSAAIDRYRSLGVWGRDPHLPRAGFERLRSALLSGGLIERTIPYEACIDMRFADAVIAEDPPGI